MTFPCYLDPGWYAPCNRNGLEALGFQFGPVNAWGNAEATVLTGSCTLESLNDLLTLAMTTGEMPITLEKRRYRDGDLLPLAHQHWCLFFAYEE